MIQSRQSNNDCHTLKMLGTWQTINPQDTGPQQSQSVALSLEDSWRTTVFSPHWQPAEVGFWCLWRMAAVAAVLTAQMNLPVGGEGKQAKAKFLSPLSFCLCSLGFYFSSYLWFSALSSCPTFPQWWTITGNVKIKRTSSHVPICSVFYHNNRQAS